MASKPNWYQDENPFMLAKPPSGFLRELRLFDDQLVVLPSRQARLYRLTRRTKRGPGIQVHFQSSPDTKMMAAYQVVPVTSIMAWTHWEQGIFDELRRRDTWHLGGPKETIRRVEEHEAQATQKANAQIEDEAGERARSAYDAWKLRSGQAVHLGSKTPHRKGPVERIYSRPVAPANTAGGMLYGPDGRKLAVTATP